MDPEFPHEPPKGYSYEFKPFKRNYVAIWISDHRKYDYNNGADVHCIWGFYNTKTREYHSPTNPSTVGDVVSIKDTTPYSAMLIKRSPLEAFFQ